MGKDAANKAMDCMPLSDETKWLMMSTLHCIHESLGTLFWQPFSLSNLTLVITDSYDNWNLSANRVSKSVSLMLSLKFYIKKLR